MTNPFETINNRLTNLEAITLELLSIVRGNNTASAEEVGGINLAKTLTRLSTARIYTLASQRKIPHAKRGNRLTFRRSELLSWLAEGARETVPDDDLLPFGPVRREKGGQP